MALSPFWWALFAPNTNDFVDGDHNYFLRALEQAHFAMGSTHPNPCVGAILVKEGSIMAQGYTEPPGRMHAEKHAIAMAEKNVEGSSLYVTLEPCSHFGRTPPCTTAIINAGIKRVVFGVYDPNPLVSGSGVAALKNAGIEVSQIDNPHLQEMAEALVRPFQTWLEKKRPFIVVKIATSFDGHFSAELAKRTKITGPVADVVVHHMRRIADAIMVGANTARIDDPLLTARLGPNLHAQQPASVIVSSNLHLPLGLKLLNRGELVSIIVTTHGFDDALAKNLAERGVRIIGCGGQDGRVDLAEAFAQLAHQGFTSVMVEAGPTLFKHLINGQLADEVWWFRSPKIFKAISASAEISTELMEGNYQMSSSHRLGEDQAFIFNRR